MRPTPVPPRSRAAAILAGVALGLLSLGGVAAGRAMAPTAAGEPRSAETTAPSQAPRSSEPSAARGHDRFDAVCTVEELRELEQEVVDLVARVRPTVVYLRGEGPRGGSSSGTAVVIGKDGLLATCGHVGREPGRAVTAILPDGTELSGVTLGQCFEPDVDCGLVQLDTGGRELPAARLGTTEGLASGDWLVAMGYTHGLAAEGRPALVRVGRVLAVHRGALLFDAPIDAGDSGGPSFNLRGEVVGLNSRCGRESWQNVASPIDLLVERMDSLLRQRGSDLTEPDDAAPTEAEATPEAEPGSLPDSAPEQRDEAMPLPEAADEGDARPRRSWRYPSDSGDEDKQALERSIPLASLAAQARAAMLRVHCGERLVAFAVVVDGSGLAVTKASQLEPRQPIVVESPDGVRRAAHVASRDDAADLALLRIDLPGAARRPELRLPAVEWDVQARVAPGAALVTAWGLDDRVGLGFAAIERRETEPDLSEAPFLGVQTRRASDDERARAAVDHAVVVVRVVPGSAAERSGIALGDMIVSLAGVEIESPDQLRQLLGRRRVGERVALELAGEQGAVTLQVALGKRSDSRPLRRGNTATPISRRSSGFGPILAHDTVTAPEEMGTLLLDLDGRVVGMNIARYDRTATHAIGADRMARLCRGLVGRARRAGEAAGGAAGGATVGSQGPLR